MTRNLSTGAFCASIALAAICLSVTVIFWFSNFTKLFDFKGSETYSSSRLSELYDALVEDKTEDEKLPESDENLSLTEIIKSFDENQNNSKTCLDSTPSVINSTSILILLSKRLRDSVDERNKAAELNLHSSVLNFIQISLPTGNHQDILVAIGMINELLQIPSALNLLSKDVKKMTFFIDNLLAIIKKYLWFTELDTDNEGNLYEASSYSETEIMMVDFFAENGYKFVLALGVVITENLQAQSLCADKKSIEIILRCLKLQNFSSSLSKWCIWILMIICFEHPPNKSIFVYAYGLTMVLDTLRACSDNCDIQRQGLSLLYYILCDDKQSKFHIKDARKTTLSYGIIAVIEKAQFSFKDDCAIQSPCKYLLQILATEI